MNHQIINNNQTKDSSIRKFKNLFVYKYKNKNENENEINKTCCSKNSPIVVFNKGTSVGPIT